MKTDEERKRKLVTAGRGFSWPNHTKNFKMSAHSLFFSKVSVYSPKPLICFTCVHGTDKNEQKSQAYLVEIDGFFPTSCLHQKFISQDAIIRAISVAGECDATSLPVLVKCLLESFSKPQQDRLVRCGC